MVWERAKGFVGVSKQWGLSSVQYLYLQSFSTAIQKRTVKILKFLFLNKSINYKIAAKPFIIQFNRKGDCM
ncbi:MAG: hypothetical protein CV087_03170 [Candidatus Brocadia sp. WS118]|nr:MAG: hypothetical protein CV087_03170 [Candidatus Brocadia sp. WS118]